MSNKYSPSDQIRSIDDLRPEDRRRVEENRERWRREHPDWNSRVTPEEIERDVLQVAITSGTLPGGVGAVVIRDPRAAKPHMAVFSESSLSDRMHMMAAFALSEDIVRVPAPTGRRVLRVWPDQRVDVEGTSESFYMPGPFPSRGFGLAEKLRQSARTAPATELRGVGTVQIAPFE